MNKYVVKFMDLIHKYPKLKKLLTFILVMKGARCALGLFDTIVENIKRSTLDY